MDNVYLSIMNVSYSIIPNAISGTLETQDFSISMFFKVSIAAIVRNNSNRVYFSRINDLTLLHRAAISKTLETHDFSISVSSKFSIAAIV